MKNPQLSSLSVSNVKNGDSKMKKTYLSTVILIVAMLALTACSGIAQAANVFNNGPQTVTQQAQVNAPASPTDTAAPVAQAPAAQNPPAAAPIQQSTTLSDVENTLESIYAKVSPSVVTINV